MSLPLRQQLATEAPAPTGYEAEVTLLSQQLRAELNTPSFKIFSELVLEKPVNDKEPWKFVVQLDPGEFCEAEIATYGHEISKGRYHGQFEDAALETAKRIIKAQTPHMSGLNRYKIELTRK